VTYWGFDYSWARPSASFLRSNGVQFVCRYLSWLPNGKVIQKAEYDFLMGLGIAVVLNWEYYADDMIRGANHYADGQVHAREAERQRKAMGAPAAPIYFSADFDAQPRHQGAINSYLDGVASVIGRDRVGIYASYYVVERTLAAGKATWAWQTYAWSYGNVSSRAHLYQYQNGVLGGNYDRCRSLKDNFGQITKSGVNTDVTNGASWMSNKTDFLALLKDADVQKAMATAVWRVGVIRRSQDDPHEYWAQTELNDAKAAAQAAAAGVTGTPGDGTPVTVDQATVQAAVEAALQIVPGLVQAAFAAAVEDLKATISVEKEAA